MGQLKSVSKRTINYQSKVTTEKKNQNLRYLIGSSF